MPDFEFVSPSLEAFGPTIEIEVRVSTTLARILIAQNKPVPPPVAITAIIDTGASWCLFTPDVYARLQIEPFDVATISTASDVRHSSNVYNVARMSTTWISSFLVTACKTLLHWKHHSQACLPKD